MPGKQTVVNGENGGKKKIIKNACDGVKIDNEHVMCRY